ncbi:MAG: nitrate/nitrite transporter NrtS, partial [Vicinamibacteria bacterium]
PRQWVRELYAPAVVRRAIKYAIVVGAILVGINHGDALARGEITSGRILKMALTVLVPYTVSTLSSIGAMRELSRKEIRR